MRCALLLLLLSNCGCSSLLRSRYAMDDPVYAKKYAEGAERWDLLGKAKQAIDARHTEGLGGIYLSGGAQVRPESGNAMFGAELGGESYATNWLTTRGSVSGYYGDDEGFAGVEAGARLQTPTRIAPFVGVGTALGASRGVQLADNDGIDNDDDWWVDEAGESYSYVDNLLSVIYPEVGVHAWINGSCRVTTFGRYLITSRGRNDDDWLIGLQLTVFTRPAAEY